jgi:hypothetical protein
MSNQTSNETNEVEFDTHTHECRGCGSSVRCGNEDEDCDGGEFSGYCEGCYVEEPAENPCNCQACLIGDGH